MDIIDLPQPLEFQWDRGNKDKNWLKHRISIEECEQVFLRDDFVTFTDIKHFYKEPRYVLLGKNNQEKILSIAFTIRSRKVRIISARPASNRERKLYEEEIGLA